MACFWDYSRDCAASSQNDAVCAKFTQLYGQKVEKELKYIVRDNEYTGGESDAETSKVRAGLVLGS